MSNSSSSSVMVLFRGLVMLAFLIGVPALAIFNTNVSDTLRQLAERHLGITFKGSASGNSFSEAPLYVASGASSSPVGPGTTPPDAATLTPPVISLPEPSVTPPSTLTQPSVAPGNVTGASAPAVSPPAIMPQGGAPPAGMIPVSPPAGTSATLGGVRTDPAVIPVAFQAPADPRTLAAAVQPAAGIQPAVAGPTALPPRAALEADGSLRQIQQRLHELGATYVLLESFGNQGLYRFYCKMAMGGNANYTRYFEATDPDPVRAMTQVLQQVEAWRGGR